jgi:hypothetical protein
VNDEASVSSGSDVAFPAALADLEFDLRRGCRQSLGAEVVSVRQAPDGHFVLHVLL